MLVQAGTGNIRTREEWGDVQLHIEWQASTEITADGQGRSNSGVFLMGLYEVQVLIIMIIQRTPMAWQVPSMVSSHPW